jgi:iron complex outermembrane receptor protein
MKSHANATKVTRGLSALLAASVSLPVAAQQLEEVVVTATKRSESLQDVPISVTAFSQEDMDLRGFSNLQGFRSQRLI